MSGRVNPLAGKHVPSSMLVNVPRLTTAYFVQQPDAAIPAQRVAFGTSGHRGSSFHCAFNEAHIVAATQAICAYRKMKGIDGPLFVGIDTHALSEPRLRVAVKLLSTRTFPPWLITIIPITPTRPASTPSLTPS